MQDRQSNSINRMDTAFNHCKQLNAVLPASKIAAHSSGEFLGLVADEPLEKIKLNMFNSEIISDHEKLKAEGSYYRDIPVVSNVTQQQVLDNYHQVKMDIKRLIGEEMGRLRAKKD